MILLGDVIRLLSLTDSPELLPYQSVVVHEFGRYGKRTASCSASQMLGVAVGFHQMAAGKGGILY